MTFGFARKFISRLESCLPIDPSLCFLIFVDFLFRLVEEKFFGVY